VLAQQAEIVEARRTLGGAAQALGQQQKALLVGNRRDRLAPDLVVDKHSGKIAVLAIHARLAQHRLRMGPQLVD